MVDIETFARRIPKIELHLHLEGAVRPGTFVELARKNGIELPPHGDISELYRYDNLPDFLKIYDLVSQSIRDSSDFHRITYEMLESCADSGARHVEFFFSPHAHQAHGVAYTIMLAGIFNAMDDIETDRRLTSRLIPAHSRELGLERGFAFLDLVQEHRTDKVIGIGLDYNEAPFPPAPYQPLFERAATLGLHRTAHAGESGPAENVRDSLAILGVDRIDHGYHVVDDDTLVAACREQGVFFTCCPSTTEATTIWRDLAAPDHAMRQMIEAGLNVTINSDDPPMFGTDLGKEYALVATKMGFGADVLKNCALNSIRASWLDEGTKATLLSEWDAEIDALAAELAAPAAAIH